MYPYLKRYGVSEEFARDLDQQWKPKGITLQQGLDLRYKAQTDLFFLAKELLGFQQLSQCHREVTDFFVKKDPKFHSFLEFAEQDANLHDRLLMLPRGGFKSSISMADTVQWIICFPNIRILLMTGTVDLADEFLQFIKRTFKIEYGQPTKFQVLFPEHCFTGKGGSADNYTTPARTDSALIAATVFTTSVESTSTGQHSDILKADDCTTAENTSTAGRIKAVNRSVAMARKLVDPHGYIDRIGTPYSEADQYSLVRKDEMKRIADGRETMTSMLIRPAWVPKPGYEATPVDDLREENVTLWFPERLHWKYLMHEYQEDLRQATGTFYSQYLLNPTMASNIRFSRDGMVAATIPWSTIPKQGLIFQCWDTAYSDKTTADFTVGICALFSGGRVYLLDVQRGRFNEFELPNVIAAFANKWKPSRIALEDSVGVRWLRKEIMREQAKLFINIPLEFVPFGQGSKSKALASRAKTAIRLLGDKRLFFSNAIPKIEDIFEELSNFPAQQHDDVVACLSLLVNHFGNLAEVVMDTADHKAVKAQDAAYRLLYGVNDPQPGWGESAIAAPDDFGDTWVRDLNGN